VNSLDENYLYIQHSGEDMKRILVGFFAVSIISVSGSLCAADGDAIKSNGTVIAESKTEEQAIVRDIDLKTRKLTLAMANGSLKTLFVDELVKRFDKIQPGDVVKTTYSEAIAVKLRKTKIKPGVKVEDSLTRDSKSVKPAGKRLRQVITTASIEAISEDFRTVTLKKPDGKVEVVDVRNPDNLKKLRSGEVKVGDQIDITYTQAVAISVEKVEPAKKP
jgi:hypothetical protein